MPLAIDYQLRKDRCMSSRTSRPSNPPLCSSQMRSVDDELISRLVECRRGLQTGHIGAMGEFCHGETADDSVQAKDTAVDPVGWR